MSNRQLVMVSAIVLITLGIGIGAGLWLAGPSSRTSGSAGTQSGESREPLFYRNPMNPTVTSPVPAKDSMGMDYVPVYAEDGDSAIKGTVSIDPVVTQNIGVRTAIAVETSISRVIRTVGRIDYAEPLITRLHPKTAGWIETMFIDTTGEPVQADTILLSIYSPRLVSSQEEYVLALKNLEQLKESPFEDVRRGAEELVESSRARLELLDVPPHQIEELEESRKPQKSLHIHSPKPGIIMSVGARSGQHVTPNTELYMIADLSKVWAYADIFEYELPWVKVGDEVEMSLSAVPGRIFKGTLDYIYPYAQSNTRTVKVRLTFENPDLLLKPEMFAEIVIRAGRRDRAVVVPSEAVVRSGTREQVFVVREPGKFEPRNVELGLESEGRVSVISGVEAGETIVTSALFLIDSESKLREAAAKMTETGAGETETHDMQDMEGVHDMEAAHDVEATHDMKGADDMENMNDMPNMEEHGSTETDTADSHAGHQGHDR